MRAGVVLPAGRGGSAAVLRKANKVSILQRKGWTMYTSEIHAKAIIAAALIASHAVEVPQLPDARMGADDVAATRLRELTEYVYRAIVGTHG